MWFRRTVALGVGCAVAIVVGQRPADTAPGECAPATTGIRAARDTTDELRLRLNVPAYRLDVTEQGRTSWSIPVAVGQPKYRTPLGHFQIDYLVWNPWWRPPDSYWARNERPQAPGWSNPVGRVKLHVTGLVFLHGTPLEDSRGTAASHACVRMSNADAIALARLVHRYAGPAVDDALLDSLVADTSRTRTLTLARTVPVDIEYRIAEVRGDTLAAYPDVYGRIGAQGRERELLLAIASAGIDTSGVVRDSVRALARASRRAAARMPLAHLVVPGEPLMPPPSVSIDPRP
jgi:murein L,D-transpeptidase YcbB/YkuD